MRATLVFSLVLAQASGLSAQPRGSEVHDRGLELVLPVAVRLGEAVVSAGRYRVSVNNGVMALAHPSSMVTAATVAVTQASASEAAAAPTVYLRDLGKSVEIVLLSQADIFTAPGTKVEAPMAASAQVALAGKNETAIAHVEPALPDEVAAVDAALARFLPSLLDCGDKAQRHRWPTDDARFVKCVCPLVDKWRLPKVSADLRVHRVIVKGKSGVSVTVGKDGRARQCRVWSGPQAPAEPASAPSAVPSSASGGTPAAPATIAPAPR